MPEIVNTNTLLEIELRHLGRADFFGLTFFGLDQPLGLPYRGQIVEVVVVRISIRAARRSLSEIVQACRPRETQRQRVRSILGVAARLPR